MADMSLLLAHVVFPVMYNFWKTYRRAVGDNISGCGLYSCKDQDSIIDNCVQIAMHPNFTVHACDPIFVWIQLHKDVIALTVYSWDSPSKVAQLFVLAVIERVGESPDQSKAKLALTKLAIPQTACSILFQLSVLLICLIAVPICFTVITIASILVSLPRIAKALLDWRKLQKVSELCTTHFRLLFQGLAWNRESSDDYGGIIQGRSFLSEILFYSLLVYITNLSISRSWWA
ncbi:hypothetical protein NC651_014662 [Populus alba x Populus x berolinensis]|nr:hypothetical protein NC651_014662 [Populus alba x Populus x berolinensis]